MIILGSQNERAELRRTIKRRIENGDLDVVLCTYTIFERESCRDDRKFINKTSFQYMILDEGIIRCTIFFSIYIL